MTTHCVSSINLETMKEDLIYIGSMENCIKFCALVCPHDGNEEAVNNNKKYVIFERNIKPGKYDGGLKPDDLLGTPIR